MHQFKENPELSQKQLEILKLFSQGMMHDQVAKTLNIASKTLRVYLTVIFKAIGAKKVHQAVVWYLLIYKCC
jgi:DNA-binding NarL/FixJ family response regulator